MKQTIITIQDKKDYIGNAEKSPEGDFYGNGNRYTCWDKILYSTFKVGDTVLIDYTEKENVYGGKTYINKNISKITYAPTDGIIAQQSSPQQSLVPTPINDVNQQPIINNTEYFESELVSGRVKIGNSTYEVILMVVNVLYCSV